MKRKRSILRRVLRAAELPQELDASRFFVQWYGSNECLVEQHRGILCFDGELIRFQTDQGVLNVTGKALVLDALTDSRAMINGQIHTLSIEEKS
ncbi:MAG: YabP/YqfC family sporulation protein [Clostridia bacterium]|nr:YabP/YqfC family sporulation protein [Clostridia bacterium]